MSFHDIRFPDRLSFGALGGPERRTDIVTLVNGHEERNTPWAQGRRRYDAGVALQSLDDMAQVIAFFEARRGRLHGFRWKDWSDFTSSKPLQSPDMMDQLIGIGDDVTASFQLIKTYRSGDTTMTRPICKPVAGTVEVAMDGVRQVIGTHFDVDATTGIVTFAHPPNDGTEVTAGYEFDVPVRFDTDHLAISVASFQAGEIPNVPLIEVRA